MSEEPEVMLLSGKRVNEALFEWIVDYRARDM